jgi:tripartite-type tricarboxylate transporter receptor subunit TctC
MVHRVMRISIALLGLAVLGDLAGSAEAWEPTKPVEFIVPAGTRT